MTASEIVFEPLVAPWVLAAAGILTLVLLFAALLGRGRGTVWRAAALAGLWAALLNPTFTDESREPLDDIAALVIDRSHSQQVGDRPGQTSVAADAVAERLSALPRLEVRQIVVDHGDGAQSTRLFGALTQAFSDVPRERIAGAIVISDGQAHDAPESLPDDTGPLHLLLTGDPEAQDRRLTIEQAPGYGVVGDMVNLVARVEDDAGSGASARLEIRIDGELFRTLSVTTGAPVPLSLPIEHAGATAIELSVSPGAEELTLDNNRALAVINGVRDRLRVMLVSGEPHQGLRTWRNLLKADPSVDLVHFTILRPPHKQDRTPVRELSLIPFPANELFDAGLQDFDLVIFDNYHRRGILPMIYLGNIVDYVLDGGAVLDAAGPAFASPLSLAGTPLGTILPGRPTGRVFRSAFHPMLTADGLRHPVTGQLPGGRAGAPGGNAEPDWGRWFRHIDVELGSGITLMDGYEDRPLLVLDRIGEGRVAQLLSDHSWLWARGIDGGGPQADLLRRLVHWLMKEPDLEEETLVAEVVEGRIAVSRRSLRPITGSVTAAGPAGEVTSHVLVGQGGGRATADIVPSAPGLYRFEHDGHTAIAVVGSARDEELEDVRATDRIVGPLAEQTGGHVYWLARDKLPDIRRIRPGREPGGRGWIGLFDHQRFTVTGLRQIALIPGWVLLLLALGGLLLAWRAEGR